MNGLEQLTKYLFRLEANAPIEQDKIETVKCAMKKLSANDNTLISKRYGIGQDRQYTLKELAALFGTDREWVRMKESRILRTLQREISQ